jgi:hypothetical protein
MSPAEAFELAGRQSRTTEIVTGHAHAAVNAMARGAPKDRAKVAIDEVKAMSDEFGRLTFALEYAPDMTDEALRAWAADLVAVLRG